MRKWRSSPTSRASRARADFKEEAERAGPETEAGWWLRLAGSLAPLPAARDMAGGRDRGDLGARQLVFLLPGKHGRRVDRRQRREVLAHASIRPRGPGEGGHSVARTLLLGHVSQHAGNSKPGSERRVR